jgi:hypothetical protein
MAEKKIGAKTFRFALVVMDNAGFSVYLWFESCRDKAHPA